ncbi:carbohydrate ABC transporter permease [Aggregatilinea lenta]|uniref:carbohydrate ABC transporter permease n=1 Tax=Aggregatilinea lenta TaxID=913108 RepID=UPI000E5B4D45|nr:sugar ABC transporter permease [Aggregatilinea lenta]
MSQVDYAVHDELQSGETPRRRTLAPRRAQILWGYVFLAPWIIGFLIFVFGPMLASLYLSLTDYNIEHPSDTKFIGFDHYQRMFSVDIVREDAAGAVQLQSGYQDVFNIGDYHLTARDQRFWKSIQVTLNFALFSLPVNLILALTFAVLTNTRVPGVTLFRTLFYLPSVIPTVVAAFVFQQFLRTQDGWLNMYVLHPLGLGNPGWLQDPNWAIPALTLVGTWGVGTAMLMFLAGLQNVPTELYEAARVDGAGWWSRLRHITVPMISPVILYNLVIGLIGTFQYFVIAYTITIPAGRGGNELSMYVYNLHVYREAYVFFDMGYASALAWFLLVIVLIVTGLVFRSSSKWVYYAAGGKA